MIPVKWVDVTKKSLKHIKYPAIAQLKLDGELIAWNGEVIENSYGNFTTNVDTRKFPKDCILFGEKYYDDAKNVYVYSSHKNDKLPNKLRVRFFDVISYRGRILYGVENYQYRYKVLCQLTDLIPPSYEVNSAKQVNRLFKEQIGKGYEGIVLKPLLEGKDSSNWIKLKRVVYDRLYIRGKKKDKDALLVGTPDKVLGAVSMIGWNAPLRKAFAGKIEVVGEDREAIYFACKVVVTVRYSGFCLGERESKLRNPVLHNICEEDAELTIK